MRLHASCALRDAGAGPEAVLLLGPSGSGKSDLLLRLLRTGFRLVADDQVLVEHGIARAPAALAGLLEVHGLGIFRLPYVTSAPLRLAVQLGTAAARLPEPALHPVLNLPLINLDPALASAPDRVILALDALAGAAENVVGAFSA